MRGAKKGAKKDRKSSLRLCTFAGVCFTLPAPKPMSSIKRIGIVLKPHQPQALKTICELVVWLAERGITLAGGPDLERERIEHETGCPVPQVEHDNLAA